MQSCCVVLYKQQHNHTHLNRTGLFTQHRQRKQHQAASSRHSCCRCVMLCDGRVAHSPCSQMCLTPLALATWQYHQQQQQLCCLLLRMLFGLAQLVVHAAAAMLPS